MAERYIRCSMCGTTSWGYDECPTCLRLAKNRATPTDTEGGPASTPTDDKDPDDA